jgi:hypothetical protein
MREEGKGIWDVGALHVGRSFARARASRLEDRASAALTLIAGASPAYAPATASVTSAPMAGGSAMVFASS